MDYVGTELRTVLGISKIFSVHYFEYMSDYAFEGETHDFWELLYADRGEVEVISDDVVFTLGTGEIVFHKPNEFHSLKANGVTAPNLVVVSFECCSEDMQFFENQRMHVSGSEKKILSQIISEARGAFSSPLDKTYLERLERYEEQVYGSEQMIATYLQQLLISLVRRKREKTTSVQKGYAAGDVMTKENYDAYIYQRTIDYMHEQIKESLTLNEICKDLLVSRSKLQNIFNARHRCGVMHHFSVMKIEMSKKMMREAHMNFTGIADYMGYKSIHYFSRQFKKITNMTPSEYVASVKGMSEANG